MFQAVGSILYVLTKKQIFYRINAEERSYERTEEIEVEGFDDSMLRNDLGYPLVASLRRAISLERLAAPSSARPIFLTVLKKKWLTLVCISHSNKSTNLFESSYHI